MVTQWCAVVTDVFIEVVIRKKFAMLRQKIDVQNSACASEAAGQRMV
jgi:hypothetical protein